MKGYERLWKAMNAYENLCMVASHTLPTVCVCVFCRYAAIYSACRNGLSSSKPIAKYGTLPMIASNWTKWIFTHGSGGRDQVVAVKRRQGTVTATNIWSGCAVLAKPLTNPIESTESYVYCSISPLASSPNMVFNPPDHSVKVRTRPPGNVTS